MAHTRITPTEREIISTELAQQKAPSAIARRLGRSRSTIMREIRRNTPPNGSYSAFKAQARAERMASSRRGVRKAGSEPVSVQFGLACLILVLVARTDFQAAQALVSMASGHAYLARIDLHLPLRSGQRNAEAGTDEVPVASAYGPQTAKGSHGAPREDPGDDQYS